MRSDRERDRTARIQPVPGFFEHPEVRRRNTSFYIDARDLGPGAATCAWRRAGLGIQVFNAGNDDCTANVPTKELVKRFYPGPVTRELGENEALYSNRKVRDVLGFREEHDWRKYVRG